jgi:hydroxyacylglutathione hydrolase
LTVHTIPILKDNYAFVIEAANNECLIVDPGEAQPVQNLIQERRLRAIAVLNTHHHGDHIAGNDAFSYPVIGPEKERAKIKSLTQGVKGGDVFTLANLNIHVIETPGHTAGHIAFYIPALHALFTGDTVFSMGCGRLLEGSADEMFESLQRIKSLPPDINIYCGHEYTHPNARFALSVEPDNPDLHLRIKEVELFRARNAPTIPVTLEMELKTNPFLRIQTAQDFATLRRMKDHFI